MFDLALVTGATSGIGKALVHLLHKKKIETVGLGSRDGDLSTEEGRQAVRALIREKKPNLVINSAGLGFYGRSIELPLGDLNKIIDVNVKAVMEITLEAAHVLRDSQKKGVILNVSSIGGEFPLPGHAVYGGSKAFVTKFSEALDYEMKGEGIRVLASCPGMVATEFSSRAAKKRVERKGAFVLSAEQAAATIWGQIVTGRTVHLFPFRYRLLSFLPSALLKKMIYKRMT
ncbi:MAG: SDR family NAD(P)-dependent oxidoreductase [Chlamydiales bacterium]|nr:SDR family NAD(P)-dependent oxidoreductase [Chlamydiales bacterium]